MTQNRKPIMKDRAREEHAVETRGKHPVHRPQKSDGTTRRDLHRRPGRALRLRDGHSEVKAPRAVTRSVAREPTTQSPPDGSNASSDAASLLLLVLAYGGMAAFFLQLLIGS